MPTYQYYRFNVSHVRSGYNIQISELNLLLNNVRVNFSGAVATAPGGSSPSGELPPKAIDNNVSTKWYSNVIVPLIVNFNSPTHINQYQFATANDSPQRDPISWTFEGSNDNNTWNILDTQTNYPTTTTRETYISLITLPEPNTITSSTTITDINAYSWPITISNGSASNPIVVSFGNNLTLNSDTNYFIIGSEFITIDGGNNNVTIDSVINYPGLILNGTSGANGYSNVTVQNINMSTSNGSTIAGSKGWICQNYFGRDASANSYINNCSTDATCNSQTDRNTGLVCGPNAYRVICNNCSSAGTISGGGIFGSNCTNCQANNCFSSGTINNTNNGWGGGGIFASSNNNSNQANNCYSTGDIFSTIYSGNLYGSGGICGESNSVVVSNCYSQGIIGINGGTDCGGIFGNNYSNVSKTAINCYSSGIIQAGFGIGENTTQTNCYVANGSWSDVSASATLTGTPTYSSGSLVNPIGLIWADIAPDDNTIPWIFATLGYSPYTSSLTTTFTQTLGKFENCTSPALNPAGHTYSIVSINDQLPSLYPTISIIESDDNLGGTICRSYEQTPVGVYNIKVMQNSDYSITNFELTLNTFCFNKGTKILCFKDNVEQYIKIEELRKGDLVKTLLNGYVPIDTIGTNTMQNNPLSAKGSMYKCGDLIVTGCHILLKDWEKKDRNKYVRNSKVDYKYRLMACQDEKFTKITDNKIYTIYNISLKGKKQYGIWAEGILTETAKKSSILNSHLKNIE